MGNIKGFLEYDRVDAPVVPEQERICNFQEFHGRLSKEEQQKQAARCMNCGVPFCQAGMMIAGMASGCPLHNLVPELNELVEGGNLDLAYRRLSITHSFPEFTSRVCPALCEKACTCGYHQEAVSTKENEKAIIEYAFSEGLVKELTPKIRTGKKVAVVGSGPSGLAAAQLLNSRGHNVTVFERSDRIGGLLRYGIPNMKLDKSVIDRRVKLMEEAGIEFRTNVNVCGAASKESGNAASKESGNASSKESENTASKVSGNTASKESGNVASKESGNVASKVSGNTSGNAVGSISADELRKEYDAIVLCCGASHPRDINAPGRDTEGIYFAVDFLGSVTKALLDNDFDKSSAGVKDIENQVKDKDVIVIGGGDTGNDCVGTCIRFGAKSVTQLEMMPCPPTERLATNPWPEWPRVLKTDYGQEESIYKFGSDPRVYQTTVKEFISSGKKEKHLKEVVLVSLESKKDEKTGRMTMVPVEGSEKTVPAQLVLIAAGFLGSESYVTDGFGVELDARTNVKTAPGSYAAFSSSNAATTTNTVATTTSTTNTDPAATNTDAATKATADSVNTATANIDTATTKVTADSINTATANTDAAASKATAKIYTAGDMHRGQSLVVWAIAEGRNAAREVDRDLMGYTNL